MANDAYASCPCGSGKKFKWCCLPIHEEVDRAFRQEAEGQHEIALRLMDEIIAKHPTNPEALGRKAQLQYQNGLGEEAENTLQKAFDLNPNYPFGHLLRGIFRQEEGEFQGALLLFRKAAELYDPESKDLIAQVHSLIVDCELRMNRPVAARAALKIALNCQPGNDELRKGMEEAFGPKSRWPAPARQEYTFQSPPTDAPAERRAAWDKALTSQNQARLSDAVRAFDQLTKERPDDAPAWYNLGLARAWLGDNRGALEALDRYVALEADETRAADAWALGEVLRCGKGMEGDGDYVEHSTLFQVQTPEFQKLFAVLGEMERDHRFVPTQIDQEQGLITGLLFEKKPTLATGTATPQLLGLGAYILILGDHLRLWNVNAQSLDLLRQEIQERAGTAIRSVRQDTSAPSFDVLLSEATSFPVNVTDQEQAKSMVFGYAQQFFEETWLNRPLKSLGGVPPVDAAGSATLRKKLRGVVQFLEACAALSPVALYEFDRLRRKLGLAGEPTASTGGAATTDITAMSAAELGGLKPEGLNDQQLEQAYQAALKLDARELASHFARTLVSRPNAEGAKTDRYPWYAHLVQQALGESNSDKALGLLDEGLKHDCEHNEGRRRNDYELRRGQVHAKRGEADAARDVFERLLQRVPAELKYHATAAEAMLSSRQGAHAKQFAEQGLAQSRQQKNRDSEQHFLELLEAAKKMGG